MIRNHVRLFAFALSLVTAPSVACVITQPNYAACIAGMNSQTVNNQAATATNAASASSAPYVRDVYTGLSCRLQDASCGSYTPPPAVCTAVPPAVCAIAAPVPVQVCRCALGRAFNPLNYFSFYDSFLDYLVSALLQQATQSGDPRSALLAYIYGGPAVRSAFLRYGQPAQPPVLASRAATQQNFLRFLGAAFAR